MEDTTKKYQFSAALVIVLICLAYLFICAWHKPVVDLTAPVLSTITLLIGYYWGSSKTSQERSEMQTKKDAAKPVPSTIQQAAEDLNAEISGGNK